MLDAKKLVTQLGKDKGEVCLPLARARGFALQAGKACNRSQLRKEHSDKRAFAKSSGSLEKEAPRISHLASIDIS